MIKTSYLAKLLSVTNHSVQAHCGILIFVNWTITTCGISLFLDYTFGYHIVNAILKMDNPGIIAGAFYLFIKHDDLKHLTGDIAYILCISLHHRVPNEIFGAQKLKGAWMIRLKSLISRTSLLQQEAIIINDIRVPIYGSNPLDRTRVQTERVISQCTNPVTISSIISPHYPKLFTPETCSGHMHVTITTNPVSLPMGTASLMFWLISVHLYLRRS